MEIIHLTLLSIALSTCRQTRGYSKPRGVGGVCHCPSPLLRGHIHWKTTTGQRSLGSEAWCFPKTHPNQEFYGGEGKEENNRWGFKNTVQYRDVLY